MPRFLHVGSGRYRKPQTIRAFQSPEWEEVSLDIDKSVKPDIVDKLPDLAKVESNSFDAVYSSHSIEHLYPHEVPVALNAFHRVLKSTGVAIIRCPDLQTIGQALASGKIDEPLYASSMGPVSAVDMLYGFRPSMAKGNLYMAHHTGFTAKTLGDACAASKFRSVYCHRMKEARELWCVATKAALSKEQLEQVAKFCISPV
ncbi:methyltransferase domain-containing protein [Microvirga sp. ACRRW]|uniref:class I SAM-dependent methyltransferase n=1 Tax=Microvirga sp. ACRRW TaxID=2918205 RepID=UPI001EF6E646|nr:methyltransferase domain-containing protein [Microvirga sp. ACRRW]MCG7394220.1 methyltransferase domain-containing protein [Microvirga sp. ACRRW]